MAVTVDPAPGTTGRLGVWRELIRDHFVSLEVAAARQDSFIGQVRTTALGELRVAEVASIRQQARRTESLARRDSERYFQIGLLTEGRAQLQQDGRECQLGPGDFAVYETDRPFCWDLGGDAPWRLLVFTWPRQAIALSEHEAHTLTARQLCGAGGVPGLVSRMLRNLAANVDGLAADGGARLAEELAELAVTAAGTAVASQVPGETSLLPRVEAFVRANLADPTLDPDTIAAAHYISTRHLHRLFAAQGRTVTRWLRDERLEYCRRELGLRQGPAPSVAEIGRRWGFSDPAVFSRAFRAHYGMAPSRYGLVTPAPASISAIPGTRPLRGSVQRVSDDSNFEAEPDSPPERDDIPVDIAKQDESDGFPVERDDIPEEPEFAPPIGRTAIAAPETGDPRVDEVLGGLAALDSLPTSEHVGVYDEVHRGLQDALANLVQG